MAMSKKDYEAIAKIVDELYINEKEQSIERITSQLALNLAELFESTNERFDTSKFLRAAQKTRFEDIDIKFAKNK
jgi:ubiquinone/menaquinone biosynthesis C-methylase UbiE